MKKNLKIIFAFLMLSFFVLLLLGCKKEQTMLDSLSFLTNDLLELANNESLEMRLTTPHNTSNPFDLWGQSFYNSVEGGLRKLGESKLKNKEERIKVVTDYINKDLSYEYLVFDTSNVNIEMVNSLFKIFISVYIKHETEIALGKSILLEDYINKSMLLNKSDKAYLLKMASLLRYSAFLNKDILENSPNKGDFEGCWIRKLQELEDSGIFTQIVCAWTWPVCFLAIVLDCIIEQFEEQDQ